MAAQHSGQTNVDRRTGDFHPSVWGDHFLKYASEPSEIAITTGQEVENLKEEVKRMLVVTTTAATELSQTLELVDTIQRLGFSYHFDEEISQILRDLMKNNNIGIDELQNYDLHIISLWFRLLRHEGYNISSDIFKKFTNREGKFKDEVISEDVQGMLSLYEAAHFMVHGEPILEEALSFATARLQSLITTSSSNLSPFLAEQVKRALEQTIRKGFPRVEARHFISIYHLDPSHDQVLLKFAKLDFNFVQKLHQQELSHSARWWRDLDIKSMLPYTRNRHVELYFMVTGMYFEPKYALGRRILIKVVCMASIIDDTYDAYGTIDELQALTIAIHRWNINCVDDLPNHMKYVYKILLDMFNEIEEMMDNEGRGSYQTQYAKDAIKDYVQSHFDEAKCFEKNYVPTVEEYMQFATVSCGFLMVTVSSFLGMEDIIATEEAFKWALKYPKIIYSASVIGRLLNDIVGHEFEQKKGEVASCIECYVKQYGTSKEEACVEMHKRVMEAWKDINQEWLGPRAVPMPLLVRALNLARGSDVMYKEEDIYTHAQGVMKDIIKHILIDPIPM